MKKAPQNEIQKDVQQKAVFQSVRVDDGPKLVLIDRGRIIDTIKLGEFDTRTVKTHHGQILSCVMEATTYYREKK